MATPASGAGVRASVYAVRAAIRSAIRTQHAFGIYGEWGSDFGTAGRHWLDLMTRRSQLQAQLALLWSAFARSAGAKFSARAATASADLDLTNIRKLYDSWIECAEQAYADTVHSDEFCRTQAELLNITTELLLAQRAQVECVARAFGMPTRSELDGIRDQIRQLQNDARPGSLRSRSKPRRPKRKTD